MASIQCLVVTVSHCWFMTKSANPVPTQPGGGGGCSGEGAMFFVRQYFRGFMQQWINRESFFYLKKQFI